AVARESARGLIAVVREPERVVRRHGDAVSPHREDALAPRADEAAVTLVDEHRVIAPAEEIDAARRVDRDVCDIGMLVSGRKLLPAIDNFVRGRPRDRHRDEGYDLVTTPVDRWCCCKARRRRRR